MIGVASYAAKATAAVERNRAAVARSERRQSDHEAVRPAGDDAEALYAWKREARDLADRVESDREALAFAESRAEQARLADVERAIDAELAAAAKVAIAHGRLTLEIAADAEKLAAKLARMEEMRAAVDQANQKRGARPHIVDGEFEVRQVAGAFYPAVTSEEKVWIDRNGKPTQDQILDDQMRWISNPAAVEQGVVTVVLQAEQQLPPRMPERFVDAMQIVNLRGEQLWPPR